MSIDSTKSNGRYCMEIVRRFITEMPKETGMDDFCRGVTKMVRSVYEQYGCDMKTLADNPAERMAASAVIYSAVRKEIWLVGDCHCMISGKVFENAKPNEDEIASMRSAFINNELKRGVTIYEMQQHDTGREHILPMLVAACTKQNKEYAVIDGFNMPLDKVKVIPIPEKCNEVILASDGYPVLKQTLKETEDALQSIISADPLLIGEHRATKGVMHGCSSFDDRCYLRLKI